MLRPKRFVAVAAVALALTTLCGCGGASSGATNGTSSQPGTTTTTTGTQGGRASGGTTATGATTATTTPTQTTGSPPTTQPHGGRHPGRPLVRLATACRSAPGVSGTPSGHGEAAIRALASLWAIRLRLLTNALGTGHAPIVEPLRKALGPLKKALRQVQKAPTPRTAHALQVAAGQVGSAALQIGVPECAFGRGSAP